MPVVSTEEMLAAAAEEFETCDGLIGAAAPCDYRPVRVESHKIAKTGQPIDLHLIETDDVVATLGAKKGRRWVVGFALETEDHRLRALAKLEQKVLRPDGLQRPAGDQRARQSSRSDHASGEVIAALAGSKESVARGILAIIQERLIGRSRAELMAPASSHRTWRATSSNPAAAGSGTTAEPVSKLLAEVA